MDVHGNLHCMVVVVVVLVMVCICVLFRVCVCVCVCVSVQCVYDDDVKLSVNVQKPVHSGWNVGKVFSPFSAGTEESFTIHATASWESPRFYNAEWYMHYFELKNGAAAPTRTTSATCLLTIRHSESAIVICLYQITTKHVHTKHERTENFTQAWAHRHRQTVHTYYFLYFLVSFSLTHTNTVTKCKLQCVLYNYYMLVYTSKWTRWHTKHTTSASCRWWPLWVQVMFLHYLIIRKQMYYQRELKRVKIILGTSRMQQPNNCSLQF